MDSPAEAAEYDAMDHAAVNAAFVADLRAAGWRGGRLLDLGAGTGLIPISLCQAEPGAVVTAVDAADSMLQAAAGNLAAAGLTARVQLVCADAKALPWASGSFPTVVSNSIVHHIPRPEQAFREAVRVVAPGGLLFFRDLSRPESEPALRRLVARYAVGESDSARELFAQSLQAALTVEEVRSLVGELGFSPTGVAATSDRHWTWIARA